MLDRSGFSNVDMNDNPSIDRRNLHSSQRPAAQQCTTVEAELANLENIDKNNNKTMNFTDESFIKNEALA